jgi:hypothetical protein
MEQLFARSAPRRRSPMGTAISVGLHLAGAAGELSLTNSGVVGAPRPS